MATTSQMAAAAALQPKALFFPKPLASRGPLALALSSSSSAFSSLSLAARLPRPRRGDGLRASYTVGQMYGEALADVAADNETLETTLVDMETIDKVFSDPEFMEFFASPVYDMESKEEVLEEIIRDSGIQEHTANCLRMLLETGRVICIKDVVEEFEKAYNEITETELAVVASVVKLESQHLAQIAKQVQKLTGKKNVRIKTVIDPSILAGFTVRFGDAGSKLIDISAKKQLEDITSEVDVPEIALVD